jgi:hypothetical protein
MMNVFWEDDVGSGTFEGQVRLCGVRGSSRMGRCKVVVVVVVAEEKGGEETDEL